MLIMLRHQAAILLLVVLTLSFTNTQARREGKASRQRQRHQNQNGQNQNDDSSPGGTCELEISCKNYDGSMPVKLPIKGPRGPIGSRGEPGEKGDPGEPGMPGIPGGGDVDVYYDNDDEDYDEYEETGNEVDEDELLTILQATIAPNTLFVKDNKPSQTNTPTRTVRYKNLTITVPTHLRVTGKQDYDDYVDERLETGSDGSSVYKAEEREENSNRIGDTYDYDDDDDDDDGSLDTQCITIGKCKNDLEEKDVYDGGGGADDEYNNYDEEEPEKERVNERIETTTDAVPKQKGAVQKEGEMGQRRPEQRGPAQEDMGQKSSAQEEMGQKGAVVAEEQAGVAASKGEQTNPVSCFPPLCSCPFLILWCLYVVCNPFYP